MTRTNILSNRNFAFVFLTVLMIGVGCLRIGSTYRIFWQVWDEPFHIAAGMEWLDKGQYTYERFHPPLARVMSALGPYLNGIRGVDDLDSHWVEGNAILQSWGTYERNLTLARIGILPFFILASTIVALWARNCGGMAVSLFATLCFTTLPSILAHAGLATLDMACAALVAAALFSFTLWLNEPTAWRSILLGITGGLAVLSKYSAIGFLLATGALTIVMFSLDLSRRKKPSANAASPELKQRAIASAIALLLFTLTIWTGYRFSYSPIENSDNRPYETVDNIVGSKGTLHNITYFMLEHAPIPAPEFVKGIDDFRKRNNEGHLAYLMGDIRDDGWWYFFPVVLLVKTPLPFILLNMIGYFLIVRDIFRREFKSKTHQLLVPAIATIGILVISMLGHVDNGLRQILSAYPMLAIVAGYGALKLVSFGKFVGRGLLTVLIVWQLIASIGAHPDYLPYFNELAGNHPEEIVVDSDLDWGQDLKRLASTLKNRGIKELKIKYNGSDGIDLDRFDLPRRQELVPYQRETGWIAISIYYLKLGTGTAPYDQFSWLREYQPVEKVGSSIWLYYIPND